MLGLTAVMPASARADAGDDAPPPIALSYTSDILSDVSGGIRRGTGWLGRFDLVLDKSDGFAGIPGAEAHFNLMLLHGTRFSQEYSGDAQTLSNIEAPRAIRPFEAWLKLPLASNVSVKAGYVDLNSEFDVQAVGAPFLNSSFGIAPDFSQSGLNGPSIFPVTSLGLVLDASDADGRAYSVGVFDALPGFPDHPHRFLPGPPGRDGALFVGEAEQPLGDTAHLRIGGWRYTADFARLDGHGRSASGGAYALVEGRLAGREDGAALRGWFRVGFAADEVNPIGVYGGGGLTYGDDKRLIGLGVAHARLGDPALASGYGDRRAETAIELTVKQELNRFVAVQPDVQYIIHPSWRSNIADALVVGLRLHLHWAKD
ncbi:MAG TPA: carbohydrate porin [Sphingomonas sp.]|nr:carbohydrate porin [Sphingomonas sp.]